MRRLVVHEKYLPCWKIRELLYAKHIKKERFNYVMRIDKEVLEALMRRPEFKLKGGRHPKKSLKEKLALMAEIEEFVKHGKVRDSD